ncbi:MAG: cyclic nucleotide-binding domain-containing protein [Desulfobacterium sp.]|nr:cyclic nucleotide-binding domain-containing protein [Desulfobacterium sp.]
MTSLETLESIEIFKDFTDEELVKIQELCSEEEFQRDERLFAEGEPARHMWIVTQGKVDLRFEMPMATRPTDDSTISSHDHVIPESQVFGWSCFISPYKMRLSAFCTSRKCAVVKINRTALNNLMESDTAIGFKIMKYLLQVVSFRSKQFQDEVVKFMGINMMNSW